MAGKIFVNYRRDDERAMAARVRDRLAQAFGNANVFMDVDNLMAGQRFDKELEKALAETDVFLAVMGPRWIELFRDRLAKGERDYVREEIVGALKRGIVFIPVMIEGAALPRGEDLPEDIRELVLHQKHSATHEQFGRDVSALVEAIKFARRAQVKAAAPVVPLMPWGWMSATALAVIALGWVGAHQLGVPVWWPFPKRGEFALVPTQDDLATDARKSVAEEQARKKAGTDAEVATLKADNEAAAMAEAERQRKPEQLATKQIATEGGFPRPVDGCQLFKTTRSKGGSAATVAILAADTASDRNSAGQVQKLSDQQRVSVVYLSYHPVGTVDFTELILKVTASGAEIFYHCASAKSRQALLTQAKRFGVTESN